VKNHQLVQLRTQRGNSGNGGKATRSELQIHEDSNQLFARILREEILSTYDFIAVTERLDESLVVLKLLWGLNDGDIITPSSKGGDWTLNWSRGYKSCFYAPKLNKSDQVKDYIRTDFRRANGDFLLHAIANRSLDLTIDVLGRERVNREVEKHRRLRSLLVKKCENETIAPCSVDGEFQIESRENCLFSRNGMWTPLLQ